MPNLTLDPAVLRLAWLQSQRLAPARAGAAAPLPWIPAQHPFGAALALWARGSLAAPSQLGKLLAPRVGELALVPGPRGMSWVVPAQEAPLARAFALADHASREARIAAAVPLTAKDLTDTREALRNILDRPRTSDELRGLLPAASLRTLGDPGRRSGLPTVAALVLRQLWVQGELERLEEDASGMVRWVLEPHPKVIPLAADAVGAIVDRWLRASGPLSQRAFAATFGIAAGRAAQAFKSARTVQVSVEGMEPLFAAADFVAPEGEAPAVFLLGPRDPLLELHGAALGLDAEAARQLASLNRGAPPAVVLLRGRVAGAWGWDVTARRARWVSTARGGDVFAREVEGALERFGEFVGRGTQSVPGLDFALSRPRARAVHELNAEL